MSHNTTHSQLPRPKQLGGFSYMCSPHEGCHEVQLPPGADKSGTRYSNIQECNKNCPKIEPTCRSQLCDVKPGGNNVWPGGPRTAYDVAFATQNSCNGDARQMIPRPTASCQSKFVNPENLGAQWPATTRLDVNVNPFGNRGMIDPGYSSGGFPAGVVPFRPGATSCDGQHMSIQNNMPKFQKNMTHILRDMNRVTNAIDKMEGI